MAATKTAPKAPAKKATTAKPAAKAKSAAKAPTKPVAAPPRKTTVITEKLTKAQILAEMATNTGLSKKQVSDVLGELGSLIERHIKKRGVGEFTLPGLLKIKTVKKPARKARKGINPFTGKEAMFQARPASTAVKVLALKALKDMTN